ncbi:dynein beta chain, ciliary [Caerostris extrusa]|uniref:Dynein beta chain, ciliary n=1 Tax=Caerostris extrusa TaxID=172846 RepID=A0AAV4QQG1_CAEEX|nr:dynein beta chain, ciliary [Caerostris extrusa]
MKDLLSKFENYILEKWKVQLDELDEKLDQALFLKNQDDQVLLNFDSRISAVAQEIRYLKQIKKDNLLSEKAMNFDRKIPNLLLSQSLLACSVQWYSDLSQNLVEYEKKLISKQWDDLIILLEEGYSKIWTSEGLLSYAEKLYDLTKYVYETVMKAKKNILDVEKLIKRWNDVPIYVRETPSSLIELNDLKTPTYKKQLDLIKLTAGRMNDALKLFKSNPDSAEWKDYILCLESIIKEGLIDAIKCSLIYLQKNTDPNNKKIDPFYKIHMLLQQDIIFQPPLKEQDEQSLLIILNLF